MTTSHLGLPPGPRSPAAWQLLRYSLWPLPFLEDCARRYGDPFTTHQAGYGKLIMLATPDAVKDVFRGDPSVLHSGEGNEFLSVSVGKNSVLVLDDEPHARQRRILLPPLKGERMRSFFEAMQSATLAAVNGWPVGQTISMLDPMRQITLRVILQAVLGVPPGPQLEDFEHKVERLLSQGRSRYSLILIKLMPASFVNNPRLPFYGPLHELDKSLFAMIDQHRQTPDEAREESIFADLLAATHEDGSPLSSQEIRDALLTLIVAGHETTSIALSWALEQIASHEAVASSIGAELRQVTAGAPPSAEQLDELVYLDAAIRESLRVRTILPFVVRLTKRPFVAGGREYPAGVLLCPCNHLVHRREDLYPEPAVFRPERFLQRKYAAHEWFPFGGGNRMCLGMAFSLYEMKVVLSTVLARVRLARPPGSRSMPIRRGISLAPHDGVRMVVQERLES